jgi:hypothetical protein
MDEEMPGGFKGVTAPFQDLDEVRPTLPAIGGQGRRSTERQPKLDF